jgi:hypothetical protein
VLGAGGEEAVAAKQAIYTPPVRSTIDAFALLVDRLDCNELGASADAHSDVCRGSAIVAVRTRPHV